MFRTGVAVVVATAALALVGCSENVGAGTGEGGTGGAGGTYPGPELANDVEKTFTGDDTVTSVTCENTPKVEKGVITDCTGTDVDGKKVGLRVTFDDDKGHFTVEDQALGSEK